MGQTITTCPLSLVPQLGVLFSQKIFPQHPHHLANFDLLLLCAESSTKLPETSSLVLCGKTSYKQKLGFFKKLVLETRTHQTYWECELETPHCLYCIVLSQWFPNASSALGGD